MAHSCLITWPLTESDHVSDDETLTISPVKINSIGIQMSEKAIKKAKLTPKTLSISFNECAAEDLISLLVDMFGQLIQHNDTILTTLANTTRFHSRTAPGIGIREYVESRKLKGL